MYQFLEQMLINVKQDNIIVTHVYTIFILYLLTGKEKLGETEVYSELFFSNLLPPASFGAIPHRLPPFDIVRYNS